MQEQPTKQKLTHRERFLSEMERAMPWVRLVALIEPFYPKGTRGRPPLGIERMLRVYFLQQWYSLADAALENKLYDSRAVRAFIGGDLVPDATTLLKFRHLLERHDLPRQLFAVINALLAERGQFLREGTIVDATILCAPPSTKNKAKERDPEMHQTKKGNAWHFGMKAHVGVDLGSVRFPRFSCSSALYVEARMVGDERFASAIRAAAGRSISGCIPSAPPRLRPRRRAAAICRPSQGKPTPRRWPRQADASPLASPRQLAWLLLQPTAKLDAGQKTTVAQVEQDKEVRKFGALACRFTALVQASGVAHRRAPGRRVSALTRRLTQARTCGVQALQTFATGLPGRPDHRLEQRPDRRSRQ